MICVIMLNVMEPGDTPYNNTQQLVPLCLVTFVQIALFFIAMPSGIILIVDFPSAIAPWIWSRI
jgi:hypothetical protein